MGKDVEEGEISDTASVEEISEEDFNITHEVKVVKETSKTKARSEEASAARVWTMQELYNKYPTICRGYGAGLHNIAWAQAVQKKPFNFVTDLERQQQQDDVSKQQRSSPVSSVNGGKNDNKMEIDRVVIDDDSDDSEIEREEGELEEGEIDMDSESNEKVGEQVRSSVNVDSIREALESVVNEADGDKSFQGVCSKLESTLESLQEVIIENDDFPTRDALIGLPFSAVQSVHSVFCSMNNVMKEQNRDILSRLLSLVKSRYCTLFPSDQIKEMEVLLSSLDARAIDKGIDMQEIDGLNKTGSNAIAKNVANDLTSKTKFALPVDSLTHHKPLEASKPGVCGYKSKGLLLPLLDLHKVHDADSLPSPTRETIPSVPVQTASVDGDVMVKSGSAATMVAHGNEDCKIPHYETDALRAVSSYQQKFGCGSFFMYDRLPSPTPSEESGEVAGDNTAGEISSAPLSKSRPVSPPVFGQQAVSSQNMDISNMQGLRATTNPASASSGPNPIVKSNAIVKVSVKSRDPRLRFANSDGLDLNHRLASTVQLDAPKVEPVGGVMSSRKQKTLEEPVSDGPTPKRQRNGFENSGAFRDEKSIYAAGGWLEDTVMVGPQIMNTNQLVGSAESNPRKLDNGVTCPITTCTTPNVVTCPITTCTTPNVVTCPITTCTTPNVVSGNETVPVTIPSSIASLPALLKNIGVDPTELLNMLNMGQQQKLAAEAQQKSNDTLINTMHPPSSSSMLGAIPLVNVVLPTPLGILPKQAPEVPSQAFPMDESGKVRMKPRDPRRVLHTNTLQRSGSLVPEQLKTDGPPAQSTQGAKDNLNSQKQPGQAEAKPLHTQSVPPPDITRQFTKNLKDIANYVSVSQPLTNQPLVPQNLQIQPGQLEVGVKAVVSNHDGKRTGTGSGPEVGPLGPHLQNTWGDVEHLFEGFDDQQKAAIQRERARRMEEQRKMFAARKLCLVLDLDHTLLNSAKFNEVDPVHDEILRKKEEQDREKPQRHLFRLSHMGMWTKLRPGVWNFLERASKLYELHLYTMGNKLYATEMAKVLDPKGTLFAGRVISRGDDGDSFDGDERVTRSKDLEGVLGMESAVVIIDDSVRVWPHNKLNLIVVERYTYFPCSRRQFGLLGPSLLEIDHDERPEDGTLASSLAVIERIHKTFFSHQCLDDVDVRNILATEQRKILAGCRIVFSRVFPVGEANPHLHPLWQTAEQFGAVCMKNLDDQVTHVVANSLGTDKVNWAITTGRFVVHPGWVEASALLYRRANEQDFAIKP